MQGNMFGKANSKKELFFELAFSFSWKGKIR
jgi:hypothetical protein